jgi:hypothetical protein
MGFSLSEAWNTTLSEYVMLVENKTSKAVVIYDGEDNVNADMIANFQLQDIYRKQSNG